MAVDIVVVNWNSRELLEQCVESIVRFGNEQLGKIVVVDNHSSDHSLDFLSQYPDVALVKQTKNVGFAKACNIGAQQCEADYLLFLNPDAALFANTLESVIDFMEHQENQQIGICGVKLLDENNHVARSCSRTASPTGLFFHSIGLDRPWPKLGQAMREWDHLNNQNVDQVIGAFYFVRKSLFNKLSGFDERFFVYYEEVDFAYRAQQQGYSSYYLADVSAYHLGGGTSDQVKANRLFYSLRSRLQYAYKHFGFVQASFVALASLTFEPVVRSLKALLRGDIQSMKETTLAYKKLLLWGVGSTSE
ncbi:glycosyltransferase family 2 protein [Agarivorans aestuarii]|uniref:Glycosyltransferase family 2 protein n=1 Tax=Agarivorans aestuarii TaxID=1563703 RepID=A0ABU7G2Z0_9ALTE|nr:glycosyltransferase family 2 protein [Agarivorans aestuarii]MEE1672835.1 glycosyltransferase family 2 protein [Agarivorans aestuarii]